MLLVLLEVIVVLFLVYKFLTSNWDYFDKKGIPFMKPTIVVGSRSDLLLHNKSMPEVVQEWYDAFKNDK